MMDYDKYGGLFSGIDTVLFLKYLSARVMVGMMFGPISAGGIAGALYAALDMGLGHSHGAVSTLLLAMAALVPPVGYFMACRATNRLYAARGLVLNWVLRLCGFMCGAAAAVGSWVALWMFLMALFA